MSTITREQLSERAREKVKSLEFSITQTAFADSRAELEEELELARIALASLEADPVAFRSKLQPPTAIGSERWDYTDHRQPDAFELENCFIERLFTAPPAPANAEPVAWLWSHRKHPSEVSLIRPEDDERAEGAHWSGWSCQALYAAPPAPVSVPDDVMAAIQKVARIRLDLNDFDGDKRGILDCLGDAEDALIEVVNRRAAMLQGAKS